MFTISYKQDGVTFYLNHSCMSSMSFGSEDMAWTTSDRVKAELMLDRVRTINPADGNQANVTELY